VATELNNRRIAILATDGAEQVEIQRPWQAVERSGARVTLVAPHDGEIQAMNGDIDKGDTFPVDTTVSETSPDDYEALILPGGTINPDRLRIDVDAVEFVRGFVTSGKPVGALCHGPWTLAEAGVLRGRTVTSFGSIRTDLRNAGAQVLDQEVVTDQGLVTSRGPEDLPAFCSEIIEEFAEGRHAVTSTS